MDHYYNPTFQYKHKFQSQTTEEVELGPVNIVFKTHKRLMLVGWLGGGGAGEELLTF